MVQKIKQAEKMVVQSGQTLEKLQMELRGTMELLCREPGGDKAIEVVGFGSRHDDLRVLFRVFNEVKWLKVVEGFLAAEKDKGWYSFIGKKYMEKEGYMVYAWTLVLESENLPDTIQEVRRLLLRLDTELNDVVRTKVEEIPLESDSGYSERLQARVKPTRDGPRL